MNVIPTNKESFCNINPKGDTPLKIITDKKEITPTLVEEILHETKSLEKVKVKEIKEIRTQSTITSDIYFIQVKYSIESPKTAPKRLFLKISNLSFPELGKREVMFYKTVANHMDSLPLIPCYDAKYDENTGRSHILLEDISKTHFRTEYPIPPTYINCKRHIEGLAKLHSLLWDDERLEEFAPKKKDYWCKRFDYEKEVKDLEKLVQNFLTFIGDRISKPSQNILNNSIEFYINYEWECHKEGKNLTLINNDAHAWNYLYPKDDIDGKLYFCDWQSVTVFKGITDLAYFMGIHWHPERRKRLEIVLLRKYHEILEESGITNYSWNDCYNDYRSAIVALLYDCVIWQWSTKKIRAIVWWSHLERALRAFEDLNCNELLNPK